MKANEKIEELYSELKRVEQLKQSLRKTTREQYNVLTMLIKHYKKEIKRYEKIYQLSA